MDKLSHFFAGGFFAFILVYLEFRFQIGLTNIAPLTMALLVGFSKEFFDSWHLKKFNWFDFIATIAGGLFVNLLYII